MTTPPPPPPGPGRPDHNPFGQGQSGQPQYGQGQPAYGQGQPAYGQGQPEQPAYGQDPSGYGGGYGQPPQKGGGVPVWAWIAGVVVALLLICGCGGGAVYFVNQSDSSSSSSSDDSTDESSEESSEESTDETESTTDSSTTDSSTTTDSPTSSPSSSEPTLGGSQSVPPTPAGSTPNTDPQYTMDSSELESQIAQKAGYSVSEVTCSDDLVYVEGRTATCQGPARNGSGTSNIYVTVEWAVIDGGQVRAYFTFNQYS